MQLRIVRLNSRNPLVGVVLLVVILAILAVVLTAGMALIAGGAVLGTAGYLARRVFGGNALARGARDEARVVVLGNEVFPPVEIPGGVSRERPEMRRPVDVRTLPEAERD